MANTYREIERLRQEAMARSGVDPSRAATPDNDARDDVVETVEEPSEDVADEPVLERRLPDVAEPEEDTTDVDVEVTPGGTSISTSTKANVSVDIPPRPKGKKPAKSRTRAANGESDNVYLRDFPVSMANVASSYFGPHATTNKVDNIAAYIAIKSGDTTGLTPEQLALTRKITASEDPLLIMEERLSKMEKNVQKLTDMVRVLELVCVYMEFDHLGFRRDNPKSPGDVDILEPGIENMVARMRQQAKTFVAREKQREGRPIR